MSPSRKLTTGRYETREELVEEVWNCWIALGFSQARISRRTYVSVPVVARILSEPRPKNVDRP